MLDKFKVYGEEAPYYAKFDKDNNYVKVLYNPGRALQARELIDSQTYAEYQTGTFGSKFFDDAECIDGARIVYSRSQTIVKVTLEKIDDLENKTLEELKEILEKYKDMDFTSSTAINDTTEKISIYVTDYFIIDTSNYYLAFSYNGTGFNKLASSLSFHNGSNSLYFRAEASTETFPNPTYALLATNTEGTMFIDGFFVHVLASKKIIDVLHFYTNANGEYLPYTSVKYSNPASTKPYDTYVPYSKMRYTIGYDIDRQIITAQEDSTLNDPSYGTYNYKAPGANRQQIMPSMNAYYSFIDSDGTEVSSMPSNRITTSETEFVNFVSEIVIMNDVFIKDQSFWSLRFNIDTLAKRTYEESGSYTVSPWKVQVRDATEEDIVIYKDQFDDYTLIDPEDYYFVSINPGIGYIHGYRIANSISKAILVEKPRTFIEKNNNVKYIPDGCYTYGNLKYGANTSAVIFNSTNTLVSGTTADTNIDFTVTGNADIKIVKTTISSSGAIASTTTTTKISVSGTAPAISTVSGTIGNCIVSGTCVMDTQVCKVSGSVAYTATMTSGVWIASGTVTAGNLQGNTSFGNASYTETVDGLGIIDFKSSNIVKLFPEKADGTIDYENEILPETFSVDNISYPQLDDYGNEKEISEEVLNKIRMKITDMEYEANNFYIYLANTSYLSSLFSTAKYIGYDGSNYIHLKMDSGNSAKMYGSEVPKIYHTGFNMVSGNLYKDTNSIMNSIRYTYSVIITNATPDSTGLYLTFSLPDNRTTQNNYLTDIIDNTTHEHINLYGVKIDTLNSRIVSNGNVLFKSANYTIIIKVEINNNIDAKNGISPRGKTIASNKKVLNFVCSSNDTDDNTTVYFTYDNVNQTVTVNNTDLFTLDNYDAIKIASITKDAEELNYSSLVSYEFNTGQTDLVYKKPYIKNFAQNFLNYYLSTLEDKSQITAGKTITIIYYYYEHENYSSSQLYGPFSALSYVINKQYDKVTDEELEEYFGTKDLYNIIPSYKSSNATFYKLRDCLDFRTTENEQTIYPNPGSPLYYSVDVYLPRIDNVWVDKNGTFGVTKGIPAENPVAPEQVDGTLVIYQVYNEAYVPSAKNITTKYINNQRHTMKEINTIEDRVSKLEDIVSLNLLEQSAVNMQVTDSYGFNRYKSGIFTDGFTSYDNCDYTDKEFSVRLDANEVSLRPKFVVKKYDFELSSNFASSSIYYKEDSDGNVVNPVYVGIQADTTELFVQNTSVTEENSVTPLMFAYWSAEAVLTPSVVSWETDEGINYTETYDEGTKPSDILGEWNFISSTSPNLSINSESYTDSSSSESGYITTYKTNTYQNNTITASSVQYVNQLTSKTTYEAGAYNVSDVYTRMEKQDEYIRTDVTINFSLKGMAPNMEIGAYIDDGIALTLLDDSGEVIEKVKSDGTLTGHFFIPDGIPIGNKLVCFYNTHGNFSCRARAQFTGYGKTVVTNVDRTYLRTWTAVTSINMTQNSTEVNSSVQVNALIDNSSYSIDNTPEPTMSDSDGDSDPIAESFYVSESSYPNGIVLESIDVYFTDLPITNRDEVTENPDTERVVDETAPSVFLYLVEMDNGYPSSVMVPNSRVVKTPLEISLCEMKSASEYEEGILNIKSLVPTNFKFSEPIYLPTKTNYAFVIGSGSKDYKICTSSLGSVDLITGQVIDVQPYLGAFFESQNGSTWSSRQVVDITFRIHNYTFVNSSTYSYKVPGDSTGYFVDMQNLSLNTLVPTNTSIAMTYQWGTSNIENFTNSSDITLDSRKTLKKLDTTLSTTSEVGPLNISLTLSTNDKYVSPFIDNEAMIAILSHNKIYYMDNSGNEIDYDETPLEDDNYTKYLSKYKYFCGAYVSNNISLDTPSEDIRIILDAIKPSDSGIEVYVRTKDYKSLYAIHDTTQDELGKKMLLSPDDALKCVNETMYLFSYRYTSTVEQGVLVIKSQFELVSSGNTPCQANVSGYAKDKETDQYKVYLNQVSYKDGFSTQSHEDLYLIPASVTLTDVEISSSQTTKGFVCPVFDMNDRASYTLGTYVLYNNCIWESLSDEVGEGYVPSDLSIRWKKICGIQVYAKDYGLLEEENGEWRKMVESTDYTLSDEGSEETSNLQEFEEFQYVPEQTFESDFSNFSIKIEFYANDEVQMPRVKNLRAIAVI